jgi:hypothetical protein
MMKRLIPILVAVLMAVALPADAAKPGKNKPGSSSSTPAPTKLNKAHLAGSVVTASGRHAGHARLTIRKVGGRRKLHPKVNAAGHFSAKLKPGTYRISASHRSYGSGHATAAVTLASNTSVTVHLTGKAKHKHGRHRHLRVHVRHHPKKLTSPGSPASTGSTVSTGSTGATAGPAHNLKAK